VTVRLPNSCFIHIPRTGGFWLEAVVDAMKIPHQILKGDIDSHFTFNELPSHWKELEGFSFIRHPYHWVKSRWSHLITHGMLNDQRHFGVHRLFDKCAEESFENTIKNIVNAYPEGLVGRTYQEMLDGVKYVACTENLPVSASDILSRTESINFRQYKTLLSIPPNNCTTFNRRWNFTIPDSLREDFIASESNTIKYWMSLMNDEIYNKDQLLKIREFIEPDTKWFLLGGPADANEAQTIFKLIPEINILGCEPNPIPFELQQARGFPGILLPVALWDHDCQKIMSLPEISDLKQRNRCGSLIKYNGDETKIQVDARSLDSLSAQYGPFEKAVLWLDVEESELLSLIGAMNLLEQGRVYLINVEVFSHMEQPIKNFLSKYNFQEIHRWNMHKEGDRSWCDIVFKKNLN
jgi:hypothetical protein